METVPTVALEVSQSYAIIKPGGILASSERQRFLKRKEGLPRTFKGACYVECCLFVYMPFESAAFFELAVGEKMQKFLTSIPCFLGPWLIV